VKPFLPAALGVLFSLSTAFATDAIYPPGSRVGLIPPKDMVVSRRFSGFENPAKLASITIAEMPPEAYPQLAASLSRDALKGQGVSVTSHETLTIAGHPAVLIVGDQEGPAKLRKWVLALGDPATTTLLVAQSTGTKEGASSGYSDAQMRAALMSVALRAPLSIDEQMAALPFRLGDRAGFRALKVLSGNSLLLTDGPKDVIKAVEQPIVVLASSYNPVPPAGEGRDQFARAALASSQSLTDVVVERSQGFRQNGQDWHEIVARAKDAPSGQDVVVMQTIRFAPTVTVRMVGLTRTEERDQNLTRFRTVVDNLQVD
jgi:hypothetical protein